MSLYESKDSTGQVSLQDLFDGKEISATDSHSIDDIAFLICRGGWPSALDRLLYDKLCENDRADYLLEQHNKELNRRNGQ